MNTQQKGFTLIELLIVLGILGTLVIAVLVTLNPGEAQKKARDQKRMRDLATLQTVIEQYVNDGGAPICDVSSGGSPCLSNAFSGKNNQPCESNFLGVDLCRYAKSIPIDPRNGERTMFQKGDGDPEEKTAKYTIVMSGSDYEINVHQESSSNKLNLINDGGNSPWRVEVGTDLYLLGS